MTENRRSSSPVPTQNVPQIGVGAVVLEGASRVLLIRRGQPPALGLWSLPGGRQEFGESLQTACRREVFEETGVRIVLGPIVAVVERRVEGFHYVIIDFLGYPESADASILPGGDVMEVRWVPLQRIGEYETVPGLDAVIRAAARAAREPVGLVDRAGTGTDFLPTD
jgi:ADP-ribose pyrophosphatase YjhB (NUDIX family)